MIDRWIVDDDLHRDVYKGPLPCYGFSLRSIRFPTSGKLVAKESRPPDLPDTFASPQFPYALANMKLSPFAPFFVALVSAAPAAVDLREAPQEQRNVFRNELIDGDACPGSILIFARGTLELDNMVSLLHALPASLLLEGKPFENRAVLTFYL